MREVPGKCLGRINLRHPPKRFTDRLREADLLTLPRRVEERLVLPDRSSDLPSVLVRFQVRPLLALSVGVKLVRVEVVVAEVLHQRSVKLVGSRSRSDGNVQARILALLGRGIAGGDLEL